MNLVIVESPAKGKTIEKYLGSDYRVTASFGHIRDLPQNELGVDTEHGFEPKYVIPPKAQKTISFLNKSISGAENVYLATDYDREGEAIAWHILQATKLAGSNPDAPSGVRGSDRQRRRKHKVKRITFHEITKEAIQEAVKNPRDIDLNLVNAQQARRVLDRLVGYKLSPFLWKKIYRGLSAGRVQSVTVRLVVDREREIANFKSEEYWTIGAELQKAKGQSEKFTANLTEKNGQKIEKLEIKSSSGAEKIFTELSKATYRISDLTKKQEKRWPYPPFITSTLQQEASFKLGFSAKKTMKLAQDLYEAGHITYMRTDSNNLSWLAINTIRKYLKENLGKNYLSEKPIIYKTKVKGAQEAHEAIRPTDIKTQTSNLKTQNYNFGDDHLILYDLIWKRALACQMKPAIIDVIVASIKAQAEKNIYGFQARGASLNFDGFSKIWPVKIEENSLPVLEKNDLLDLLEILKKQHFTEPPARYSEATLIKALEEKGIGRPSTYAPILSTIEDRGYVRKEKRFLFPQEIGFIVTDLLVKHFANIVDLDFTAEMEGDLDKIAEGEIEWRKVLANFYKPFEKNLNDKYNEVEKKDILKQEETKEICPKCGKKMLIKMGRFGKFLACSGFPNCKFTKQLIIKIGLKCPDCKKGDIIERKTKRGKMFWGCSNYPKCKWASWTDPRKIK